MPPAPEPPTEQVAALGSTLAALASTPDDLDLLDDYAELLDVGPEVLGPLLLIVLVEPLAGAQILPVGHACPGLTFRVDADLDLRVVLPEELQFYDHETDTYSSSPPPPPAPADPQPGERPAAMTGNVAALGMTLNALASSASDRHYLRLAADALHQVSAETGALLLTVLVEPLAGAQISLVPCVQPGTSISIDDDLRLHVAAPFDQ